MAVAASSNPITSVAPSSSPITSVQYPAPPLYPSNNQQLLSRLNLDLRGRIFPVDREVLMLLPESVLLGLFPQGLILSKPAGWEGEDGVFQVDVSGHQGGYQFDNWLMEPSPPLILATLHHNIHTPPLYLSCLTHHTAPSSTQTASSTYSTFGPTPRPHSTARPTRPACSKRNPRSPRPRETLPRTRRRIPCCRNRPSSCSERNWSTFQSRNPGPWPKRT